ncbi:uncharacterized protein LOC108668520 isoform X1 [Hyalella azteca]|uniref:Uncharacterized protein LOC108668520 isoform X1 n=1 Tax=Hyalella azteca TaxID=294128 RepID=A0A8B7NCB9_HYAAZ|nr:uncharacterized protein LOC108668520 isoform X1 [Hyalella azteca]
MLPQSAGSPMDCDEPGTNEQSMPPDICLKSSMKFSLNHSQDFGSPPSPRSCPPQQEQDAYSLIKENMDIVKEDAFDPTFTSSDLLQSACISDCSDVHDHADIAESLPDLCGGVDSSRTCSVTLKSSPETEGNLQASSSSCDGMMMPTSDCQHGAKPKIFKYSNLNKPKKTTGKIQNSPIMIESSKVVMETQRSEFASPVHPKTSLSLPHKICDSTIEEKVSNSHAAVDKRNEFHSLDNDIDISSMKCDDKQTPDLTSGYTHSNETEDFAMPVDLLKNEESASSFLITSNAPSDCGDDHSCVQINDLVDSDAKDEDGIPSLMEDYLLYDSHPISLVACGIWDCDSRQTQSECSDGARSGLLLVSNNLRSASHPMFSRWPCEAYIPSHMLIEVAFNSHGSSLGVSAEGGNHHIYGIALGTSAAADDSEAQARENEQMKLAKRMGLIHHLPQGTVDAGTSVRECVICMMDLIEGEKVRYLPCMHVYHTHCIDDWFQRSFTCPSCLEPVDAALLNTYNTT